MRCIALFVFYYAVKFHGMCELDRGYEDTLIDMRWFMVTLIFRNITKTAAYIPSHLSLSSCSQS